MRKRNSQRKSQSDTAGTNPTAAGRSGQGASPQTPPALEYIFHPRSVALVGAATDPAHWFINEFYIDPLIKFGYTGRVYAVNPKGGEAKGMRIYRNLGEIEGPVDHVVSAIPARNCPDLVRECRDRGVKVVQFYTAGFAETGDPEGIALQNEIAEIARGSGMRLLGPNCMGLYCPATKISFCANYPQESGPIGLISQSGSNSTYLVRAAVVRGLRFSKVISHGNACDINECDLLEYLADDPETKVIAAYIEGIRDGARFRRVLARAAAAKPVVIYKGGFSEGGGRAAATHTGSLAGSYAAFESLLQQHGAVPVQSVGQMVDMLVALLRMKPPHGPNLCAIGNGGGASVLATDEFERAGFRLPRIPLQVSREIDRLVPPAGSMTRNPIDAAPLMGIEQGRLLSSTGLKDWEKGLWNARYQRGDGGMGDFIGAMDDWPGLDFLLLHYSIDSLPGLLHSWMLTTGGGTLIVAAKESRLPVATIIHFIADERSWDKSRKLRQLCIDCGFPLFLSMKGAAKAIRQLMDFDRTHPGMVERIQASLK
jgi:succinyl-CoA synthetase alpha subunit